MKIAVIGIGTIGSRHASYLGEAGHEVVAVDPVGPADASTLEDLRHPSTVDAWIVATPTATHLTVVGRLLKVNAEARILLEKPACFPGELARLDEISASHPKARIIVNDIYAHSPAVRDFSRKVSEIAERDAIRKVTVEFSKNRLADVARGRFVDLAYGEVGYEWFHMLSMLRATLPACDYERYLRTPPQVVTPDILVRTVASGLPRIDMYSSMKGKVGYPELGGSIFGSAAARATLAQRHIAYGSDLRYRFVHAGFESGARLLLVFEYSYGASADYKNKHGIYLREGTKEVFSEITVNQHRRSLLSQLEMLTRADDAMVELRLPEHRFMGLISGVLRGRPYEPGRAQSEICDQAHTLQQEGAIHV